MVSAAQWSDSAVHIHESVLPQTHRPSRLTRKVEQNVPCSTAGPCCLSILSMAVFTWTWVLSKCANITKGAIHEICSVLNDQKWSPKQSAARWRNGTSAVSLKWPWAPSCCHCTSLFPTSPLATSVLISTRGDWFLLFQNFMSVGYNNMLSFYAGCFCLMLCFWGSSLAVIYFHCWIIVCWVYKNIFIDTTVDRHWAFSSFLISVNNAVRNKFLHVFWFTLVHSSLEHIPKTRTSEP